MDGTPSDTQVPEPHSVPPLTQPVAPEARDAPLAPPATPTPGTDLAVFDRGVRWAIAIAGVSLFASLLYLFWFQVRADAALTELTARVVTSEQSTALLPSAMNFRTATVRYTLLSTGVCVGVAVGFLGFALFLIGARGDTTAEVSGTESRLAARLTHLSPGALVMVASVVLVGVCATRPVTVSTHTRIGGDEGGQADDAGGSEGRGGGGAKGTAGTDTNGSAPGGFVIDVGTSMPLAETIGMLKDARPVIESLPPEALTDAKREALLGQIEALVSQPEGAEGNAAALVFRAGAAVGATIEALERLPAKVLADKGGTGTLENLKGVVGSGDLGRESAQ